MSEDSLDDFPLPGVQRSSLLSLKIPQGDVPLHHLVVVLHPTGSVVRFDTGRPPVQLLVNVSVVAILQQEVTEEGTSGQVRADC